MNDDHNAVYKALNQIQTSGETAALATIVSTSGSIPRHTGSKILIYADGRIVGTVGGGAMEACVIQAAHTAIEREKPSLETYTLNSIAKGDPGICGGTAQIFIEPIISAPTLLVIGGGHCGMELAQLGKWMRYRVILSDDRPDYCNENYLPGMDAYIVCQPEEITHHVQINKRTYIAAVTRGLPVDLPLIPTLLETSAPYIGLIGSRRRWALTVKSLKDHYDLTNDILKRVRAPIGLELEAETPKEIAISIMAEIIMLRRGGTGQPMQWLGDIQQAEQG